MQESLEYSCNIKMTRSSEPGSRCRYVIPLKAILLTGRTHESVTRGALGLWLFRNNLWREGTKELGSLAEPTFLPIGLVSKDWDYGVTEA